jgi:hypothetical protein
MLGWILEIRDNILTLLSIQLVSANKNISLPS